MTSLKGNIHSFESFGTVDGPGLRFVIFLQGCPLRCLYCHNPDTWNAGATPRYSMTPAEMMEEVLKYRSFISRGGVTVSGGEPLLQPAFLKEFFRLCREEGIHTALDTSGYTRNPAAIEVLDYTDLVLLDIKSIDPDQHLELTGVRQEPVLSFLQILAEKRLPVWIRHVLVPGYTDDEPRLHRLAAFLQDYPTVEKVELLPYHTLGAHKYEQLGLPYKLKGTPALPADRLQVAKATFHQYGLKTG